MSWRRGLSPAWSPAEASRRAWARRTTRSRKIVLPFWRIRMTYPATESFSALWSTSQHARVELGEGAVRRRGGLEPRRAHAHRELQQARDRDRHDAAAAREEHLLRRPDHPPPARLLGEGAECRQDHVRTPHDAHVGARLPGADVRFRLRVHEVRDRRRDAEPRQVQLPEHELRPLPDPHLNDQRQHQAEPDVQPPVHSERERHRLGLRDDQRLQAVRRR